MGQPHRKSTKPPVSNLWGVTIPQFSYDVLVRFIPGLFFLVSLHVFVPHSRVISRLTTAVTDAGLGEWSGLFLLLMVSYVAGWLLCLFHYKELDNFSDGDLSRFRETATTDEGTDYTTKTLVFQYFAVRELNPGAGLRLVKLRGESNMLKALAYASWLIAALVVITNWQVCGQGGANLESILWTVIGFVVVGVVFRVMHERMNRQYHQSTRTQFWLEMTMNPDSLPGYKVDSP